MDGYYCFCCGAKLEEVGLGLLYCDTCKCVLMPFVDKEGNQSISRLENENK